MRPLTRNERFLLGILSLVVLVIVTWTGLDYVTSTQGKLDQALLKAKADQSEAEVTLSEKVLWDTRAAWIAAHITTLDSTDAKLAGAKLQDSLKQSADDNKLEVQTEKIEAADQASDLPSIVVSIDVKGPMQSVIVWINTFQSSKDLVAIEYCNLKMDNDQKNMTCNLRVRKFFQEKS